MLAATTRADGSSGYVKLDLVADQAGVAHQTDARLVNAWGLAFAPNGLLYVVANGTGLSKIYTATGGPIPVGIQVPAPAGSPDAASPSGLVFNPTQFFNIVESGHILPAVFLFATEDGTIAGWNPNLSAAHAVLASDRSVSNSIYKGLALGRTSSSPRLYATDFFNRHVDMFDGAFADVSTATSFIDPNLPADYAPFGIATIGSEIFVTYAKQKGPENKDDDAGPGHGFIDVFKADGTLSQRLVTQGELNSPWGLALAPSGFGHFSHALLVGNFGDGRILAYNAHSGEFLGVLRDDLGKTMVIDGLWGLAFQPDSGTSTDGGHLYYTAGPGGEEHGVMGVIRALGPFN